MKKQILLLAILINTAALLHAQRNNRGVTLFKDCNYSGSNVSLGPGSYNTNELGIGDNVLSSIKVGDGYSVTLYEDASFSGRSTVYKNDVACLASNWNDKVSSIRITRDDYGGGGNNNGVVTLYQDCKYKGVSKTLGIGYYNVTELGIDNDALSSIRINYGYMITVYNDKDFKGSSTSFSSDVSCLSSGWNDKVSSIYISRVTNNGGGNNGGNNGGGNGGGNWPGNQKVTLYEDCNYGGKHNSLGVGYYDLNQLGIDNDALSSLTIPPGYSVTLFKDDHQKGVQTTLTANTECLTGSWNDKVSSIRIFRN